MQYERPSVEPLIRLSTSPPNEWDGDPQEASHYCDLHRFEEWKEHRLLTVVAEPFRGEALNRGIAGYRVVATYEDQRDVGLLVCVKDEAEGVMYLGIDREGHACREPAANEALWNPANISLSPRNDDR